MTIRFYSRCLLIPLLLLSLQISSRAAAPVGTFGYLFDDPANLLWDLTGDYNADLFVSKGAHTTEVALNYHLTQDNQGRLGGDGEIGVFIGTDFVAGAYHITGQVSRKGFASRANFTIRIIGDGVIAGRNTHYVLTINTTDALIDAEEGTIHGTSRVVGTFTDLTSLAGIAFFETDLPANMTGEWILALNIVPLNLLEGTGVITLSNGRTLTLNLSGNFHPGIGAKLTLTGDGESRGSSLKAAQPDLGGKVTDELSVKGEAFGQKVGPDTGSREF